MSLRDIELKAEYRSPSDQVARDFFIPALAEAKQYKRAVGFFSSTSLLEISKGLGIFTQNGGRIQLIASPKLSLEDVEAINMGYKLRDSIIKESLLNELTTPYCELDRQRLNLLANLIADEILDIKIAFVENKNGIGIYHEKMGLIIDGEGNKIAFSGSLNESKTAMRLNYEAIDVFRSWDDPELRVDKKESAFEAIWGNFEPGIETIAFPEIKKEIIERYLVEPPDYSLDQIDRYYPNNNSEIGKREGGLPKIPNGFPGFYDYQLEAIENWQKANYRGLFDMATGTGKTFTALGALVKACENTHGNIAVFIVCPYQHLVEQWAEDATYFGMKPIIAFSGSPQRKWRERLQDAVFDYNHKVQGCEFFCCICTNATFGSELVQKEISQIHANALLIADEVHNMGSSGYLKTLTESFNYRLGLSATIERHHDIEGTQHITDYFGSKCIEYPIEQAIAERKLTPYRYYPVITHLTGDELNRYFILTNELGRHIIGKTPNGETKLDKRGEMLLLERARLIAAAINKISLLKKEISPYVNKKHILVYCGAANIFSEDENETTPDNSELKQISVVVDLLGNKLDMRVSKFTAEEDIKERQAIKRQFADGVLQALAAIKCLDEGVNIPSIRTAFMLASTTNPKEYIQRRGRLLRLDPKSGKDYAEIFDFITLPRPLRDVSGLTTSEKNRELGLVKRELARANEFTRIADNYAQAQSELDKIVQSYNLDLITGDDERSYE